MQHRLSLILILLLGFYSSSLLAQADESYEQTPQKVKPTAKINGRIQYDFEFLKRKVNQDSTYALSGMEFRRVYLSVKGKIYTNIKYKMEFNFAGSQIAFLDNYLEFERLPFVGGSFTVGSFVEPTGLEMTTSSKYIPMMERAMLTTTQNGRLAAGFMYANFGVFRGRMSVQLAYTFNGKGKEGFKYKELGEGGNFIARVTSPLYYNKESHQLVHLGVNFESRTRSNDPKDYTLKFKPDNHLGEKIHVPIPNLKSQSDIGLELATIWGPFSAQAEYEMVTYTTKDKDLKVNGLYGLVSYFLNGHRSFRKGSFTRAKQYQNVSLRDGHFGGLELVVRYSMMDYSNIINGDFNNKVANLGFGLNWYLNDHIRLMYNHIITNYSEDGDNPAMNGNLLRMHVDF